MLVLTPTLLSVYVLLTLSVIRYKEQIETPSFRTWPEKYQAKHM